MELENCFGEKEKWEMVIEETLRVPYSQRRGRANPNLPELIRIQL